MWEVIQAFEAIYIAFLMHSVSQRMRHIIGFPGHHENTVAFEIKAIVPAKCLVQVFIMLIFLPILLEVWIDSILIVTYFCLSMIYMEAKHKRYLCAVRCQHTLKNLRWSKLIRSPPLRRRHSQCVVSGHWIPLYAILNQNLSLYLGSTYITASVIVNGEGIFLQDPIAFCMSTVVKIS